MTPSCRISLIIGSSIFIIIVSPHVAVVLRVVLAARGIRGLSPDFSVRREKALVHSG